MRSITAQLELMIKPQKYEVRWDLHVHVKKMVPLKFLLAYESPRSTLNKQGTLTWIVDRLWWRRLKAVGPQVTWQQNERMIGIRIMTSRKDRTPMTIATVLPGKEMQSSPWATSDDCMTLQIWTHSYLSTSERRSWGRMDHGHRWNSLCCTVRKSSRLFFSLLQCKPPGATSSLQQLEKLDWIMVTYKWNSEVS